MTRETVPAMLLHIDAEIAHRQAAVRDDWARSRRAPRTDEPTDEHTDTVERAPVLRGLRRGAHRLLHT